MNEVSLRVLDQVVIDGASDQVIARNVFRAARLALQRDERVVRPLRLTRAYSLGISDYLGAAYAMLHVDRYLILGFALITAPFPVAADERPPAMPTRDVSVSYKVDPTPPNIDTVSWLVSEGRIRTEGRALTQRVTHVIDTRTGNVTVLLDADRTYQDLGRIAAVMTADYAFVRPDLKLTSEGSDKVAGFACTIWRLDEPGVEQADAKRVCITADGVPLRLIEGGGSEGTTQYEAVRVTYAPQEPTRFRVPETYRPLEMPSSSRRR